MKVEMLSTGDEVLHGEIIDTNAVWLASTFYEAGYAMTFRTTSGDSLATLVDTLKQRSQVADILVVNGGLGPTSDDFTSQAAAQAAGVGLVRNGQWLTQIRAFFARRGSEMADINLKQADIPETAEMLPNGNGTACGFRLQLNDCQIFFTPGPPSEFQLMITEQVMPRLRYLCPAPEKLLCLRLTTFGRGESFIASQLADIALPAGVTLGYRAAAPIVEVKLSGQEAQRAEMQACWQTIKTLMHDYLLFEGKSDFATEITTLLKAQQYQLQLREGFSAGLLCWTLSSAQAPLRSALTMGYQSNLGSQALETYLPDGDRTTTLSVTISGLIDGCYIELGLVTPEQRYIFKVSVTESLTASPARLQAILVIQAMYLVHRWLTGQTVQIIYQGLNRVDET